MLFFQNVWLFVAAHGYGAIIELIVDLGDHVATHAIAIVVLKAGAVHIGYKVVKRVRTRKFRKTGMV
jgi:hypothetical protein